MSKPLPDEIQILCPNCGCLSPKNTAVCDCGYRLHSSRAAYIVLLIICFAVAVGAVFVSYDIGRSSANNAEKQIASLSDAHQKELSDRETKYEQHLAETVSEKDKEISALSSEVETLKSKLSEEAQDWFVRGYQSGYTYACSSSGIDQEGSVRIGLLARLSYAEISEKD